MPLGSRRWSIRRRAAGDGRPSPTDGRPSGRRRQGAVVLPPHEREVVACAPVGHQGVVEGNTGFRWLKGPAAVAPMFLKTPTRMRALGLVMVLALMVRNLWQYRMRAAARAAGEKITHPFTKRPVTNLTAEMAMEHFGAMQAVKLPREDGEWSRISRKVSAVGLQILGYLAISERVFWTPPPGKFEILTI